MDLQIINPQDSGSLVYLIDLDNGIYWGVNVTEDHSIRDLLSLGSTVFQSLQPLPPEQMNKLVCVDVSNSVRRENAIVKNIHKGHGVLELCHPCSIATQFWFRILTQAQFDAAEIVSVHLPDDGSKNIIKPVVVLTEKEERRKAKNLALMEKRIARNMAQDKRREERIETYLKKRSSTEPMSLEDLKRMKVKVIEAEYSDYFDMHFDGYSYLGVTSLVSE